MSQTHDIARYSRGIQRGSRDAFTVLLLVSIIMHNDLSCIAVLVRA